MCVIGVLVFFVRKSRGFCCYIEDIGRGQLCGCVICVCHEICNEITCLAQMCVTFLLSKPIYNLENSKAGGNRILLGKISSSIFLPQKYFFM